VVVHVLVLVDMQGVVHVLVLVDMQRVLGDMQGVVHVEEEGNVSQLVACVQEAHVVLQEEVHSYLMEEAHMVLLVEGHSCLNEEVHTHLVLELLLLNSHLNLYRYLRWVGIIWGRCVYLGRVAELGKEEEHRRLVLGCMLELVLVEGHKWGEERRTLEQDMVMLLVP
jgi:hypothetical protein